MKAVVIVIVLVLGGLGLIGLMSGQPMLMSIGLGGASFMLAVGSNAG
ncbi:hypothetical protein ACN4EG_27450 [Alkalinema pantanalense CENA528]